MATIALLNSPYNIGAVKFDVKVKPLLHFSHKLPPMRLNRRPMMTIRASDEGRDNGSKLGPGALSDEEYEAAIVAGNVPEAPPVPPKPAAPAGTPFVSSLSPTGDEAYNENGLVPRTIRLLKDKYPDLVIYTDVASDPYSSDGHDGIVREDGVIMNDETVHQLCKQAVAQVRAGADVVSTSDMMDGRVGAIRTALDAEGFQHVSIMSYTAKFQVNTR